MTYCTAVVKIKFIHVFQCGICAVLHGGFQGGRARRLYADYFGFGAYLFEHRANACCQATAANGNKQIIDVILSVFQNFQTNGALSSNHFFIVE